MDKSYWNTVAKNYEDEIFSVFENDKNKLVVNRIKKLTNKKSIVSDIGCGIGGFIRPLASMAKTVHAYDISSVCIDKAKENHSDLDNIDYTLEDLSKERIVLPKAHFALCVNSIITPVTKDIHHIFDVVCKHLVINCHLVLVVPSLESVLLTYARLRDWNERRRKASSQPIKDKVLTHKQTKSSSLKDGVVTIDGINTKHFLKEELIALLESRKMKVLETEKIQYGWNTEFDHPPRWMKAPFPWDWMVVAKKIKS